MVEGTLNDVVEGVKWVSEVGVASSAHHPKRQCRSNCGHAPEALGLSSSKRRVHDQSPWHPLSAREESLEVQLQRPSGGLNKLVATTCTPGKDADPKRIHIKQQLASKDRRTDSDLGGVDSVLFGSAENSLRKVDVADGRCGDGIDGGQKGSNSERILRESNPGQSRSGWASGEWEKSDVWSLQRLSVRCLEEFGEAV